MFNLWKSFLDGNFVKDIIDNFDPYDTKTFINVELNKQYNENKNKTQ